MNKELIKSYVSTIQTDLTDLELAVLVTNLSRAQINRISNALAENALKDSQEHNTSLAALQAKINQLEADNSALKAEIEVQRRELDKRLYYYNELKELTNKEQNQLKKQYSEKFAEILKIVRRMY